MPPGPSALLHQQSPEPPETRAIYENNSRKSKLVWELTSCNQNVDLFVLINQSEQILVMVFKRAPCWLVYKNKFSCTHFWDGLERFGCFHKQSTTIETSVKRLTGTNGKTCRSDFYVHHLKTTSTKSVFGKHRHLHWVQLVQNGFHFTNGKHYELCWCISFAKESSVYDKSKPRPCCSGRVRKGRCTILKGVDIFLQGVEYHITCDDKQKISSDKRNKPK